MFPLLSAPECCMLMVADTKLAVLKEAEKTKVPYFPVQVHVGLWTVIVYH